MSSRNTRSKKSPRNSEEHANNHSSCPPKYNTVFSIPRSSLSGKPQIKSPSIQPTTKPITIQTSLSRMPYSSHKTPISSFTADTSNASNMDLSNSLTQTEIDLIGVSAWVHDHYPDLHQGSHYYQASGLANLSHYNMSTSTCPYHTTMLFSNYENAWSQNNHAVVSLQRCPEEGVSGGGSLPLQLGFRSWADCTCLVIQDEIN